MQETTVKEEAQYLSVNNCVWIQRNADERLVQAAIQQYEIPEVIARVIISRGIKLDDIEEFLNPKLRNSLPDPFHLLDMDKAARRIADAIKNNEIVGIFGDYDVDGATSTALLKRYIEQAGGRAIGYIPDRIIDGYGPNIKAFEMLKKQGASLIITVDCGVVAFEPISHIKGQGVDVVVIDHHIGNTELPEAIAVVNPHRVDETTEHNYLAAVGVVFLTCVAINKTLRDDGWFNGKRTPDLMQDLDLVALGTVCDVVPLRGVNRAFVIQGLKMMARRGNRGLSALIDVGKVNTAPTSYHLGFILGPRINAGGRIGDSSLGFRLLTTGCEIEAENIAKDLDKLNTERKTIGEIIFEYAQEQVENSDKSSVLFVKGEEWHHGVVGIVAGRLAEMYHRPVAVICIENGVGKASMRSIDGVDIGSVITSAKQMDLLVAGGGHSAAGGFTVAEDKIDDLLKYFIKRLEKDVEKAGEIKAIEFDGYMSLHGLQAEFARLLEKAGPYGVANPTPRFVLYDVAIIKADIMKNGHIQCILKDDTGSFRAMAFRVVDTPLGSALLKVHNKKIHLIGEVMHNTWLGKESASFIIKDMAFR